MSFAEWQALGKKLYGDDPRKWEFRCVRCGNVQSHASVTARNPQIGHVWRWISYACEGRHTDGVGCDWSLGGLFRIHTREVVDDGQEPAPVFLFAAEPMSDKLTG